MISTLFNGEIGIVELAILFAAVGYVVQLVLDAVGISRSSKTLRAENEDLTRRNRELDADVSRLKSEIARLDSEARALRSQVQDLATRDQAAVLQALAMHEQNALQALGAHEQHADERHDRMITVLTEIRDGLKAA